MTVPCGKCAACITNKRNDWATRLRIEDRYAVSSYFITLTYSDNNLKMVDIPNMNGEIIYTVASLVKDDVQLFMKRLRKGTKDKLKYYLVGEYGEKTFRPHYHMLLFGLNKTGVRLQKYLLDKWNKGQIDIGQVNPASIRYITNYMVTKTQFKNDFIEPPFAHMSKGLGKAYIEKHKSKHHNDLSRNYMTFEDGQKSRLPRYYRDALYCENTRIKQNEKAIHDSDKREKYNWEKWAENNNNNRFEYEYDQQAHYTKKVEENIKKNSTL